MKYILISALFIIVVGTGLYIFLKDDSNIFVRENGNGAEQDRERGDADDVIDENGTGENGESEGVEDSDTERVIGRSVEGRDIVAYHYGDGEDEILFIGGIHGGYSWGTSLLAYEMMEHLEGEPEVIPDGVKVTIIPVLNPDGLSTVLDVDGPFKSSDIFGETVVGRFNANEVDLSRNFDCEWEEYAVWRNMEVSAGGEAFSEPESRALRDYVLETEPKAVIVYYAAAGGVYTSSCEGSVPRETESLMRVYAEASGYPAEGRFDAYKISGDAVDWMAKVNVPAISVLLETRESSDLSKNIRGMEAVLERYAN